MCFQRQARNLYRIEGLSRSIAEALPDPRREAVCPPRPLEPKAECFTVCLGRPYSFTAVAGALRDTRWCDDSGGIFWGIPSGTPIRTRIFCTRDRNICDSTPWRGTWGTGVGRGRVWTSTRGRICRTTASGSRISSGGCAIRRPNRQILAPCPPISGYGTGDTSGGWGSRLSVSTRGRISRSGSSESRDSACPAMRSCRTAPDLRSRFLSLSSISSDVAGERIPAGTAQTFFEMRRPGLGLPCVRTPFPVMANVTGAVAEATSCPIDAVVFVLRLM